jgi:hypothetical protein
MWGNYQHDRPHRSKDDVPPPLVAPGLVPGDVRDHPVARAESLRPKARVRFPAKGPLCYSPCGLGRAGKKQKGRSAFRLPCRLTRASLRLRLGRARQRETRTGRIRSMPAASPMSEPFARCRAAAYQCRFVSRSAGFHIMSSERAAQTGPPVLSPACGHGWPGCRESPAPVTDPLR